MLRSRAIALLAALSVMPLACGGAGAGPTDQAPPAQATAAPAAPAPTTVPAPSGDYEKEDYGY